MYSVSVIIPVYKVEKYIERCARSLFEQTLESIEFIFVDDCSPDQSIKILQSVLQEYPHRTPHTKIIRHERNRGLAAARNTGRACAQGKYIIDCDSDDWVVPDMYKQLYLRAQKDNADIVICDWNEVYPATTKYVQVNPSTNNLDCVIALLSGKMHGSVWNKLIRKDLYEKHNICCTEGINLLEDLSVTYRLFYFAKSISYINKPLYNYFKGNINSYTTVYLNEQSQNGMIKLTTQIQDFFNKENIKSPQLNQALTFFKLSVKAAILLNGKPIIDLSNFCNQYSLKDISSHPALSLAFKMALILNYIHFNNGIKLLRLLKRF